MARPYAAEMSKLAETFAWAEGVDLRPVQHAVRVASHSPLRAIGSGGSLTGAHALASLHQRYTGLLAAVATPLDAVEEPLDATNAVWMLSAGGGNNDIIAAAKALIQREPRQVGVLCGRDPSPLVRLCRQHPFVDLLLYPAPAGKDGFLATNSVLGFTALLTRAYAVEFGMDADWHDTICHIRPLLRDAATDLAEWEAATVQLWERPTTLVLYGPSTRIGAIDLESKFTEAALGNIQLADYRNFAHGRHHWLAKRSDQSGVLAFVSNADRVLAERTLDLIPGDVPQARIMFDGGPSATAISSLLAAIRITGWVGYARGIDPGRPGVPEFGRKLYNLRLARTRRATATSPLNPRVAAAVARKAAVAQGRLPTPSQFHFWYDALITFLAQLHHAHFAGIVLDYDGTLLDTRCRSEPIVPGIASELSRIAEAGTHIGIATGRGASIRRDLQDRLPRALWPLILVGYYNGAEVAPLNHNRPPDGTEKVHPVLRPLANALRNQAKLTELVRIEERPFQITLEATHSMSECRLWDYAHQAILTSGIVGVAVTQSGHSVDLVAPGVSKLNVVRRLREAVGDDPILVIGDRGRWPGNDHELLSEPFALGVDEISGAPATCWHLGAPGQRGPAVTFDYLSALEANNGRLVFEPGAFV